MHSGQCERGRTILCCNGKRWIHTLEKLPTAKPNKKYINNVEAKDSDYVYIENKEMKSYSKSAIYVKETETLELFNNVKIIKGSEVTTGDYANINMITNNYSIRSNDNAIIIDGYLIKPNDNKVKLLIDSSD